MLRICFTLGLLLFIGTTQVIAKSNTVSPIYWDTPQGIARLNETQLHHQFTSLVHYFTTQQNKSYCGPASAAMILNALKIPPPPVTSLHPYSLWNQDNIFTTQVIKAGITTQLVKRQGVTLDEETQLLNAIPKVRAIAHHVSNKTPHIKKELIQRLNSSNQYILINYHRSILHQTGYGHISAAAAYDKSSDSILILDVSRYKYPPFWVKTDQLIDAMNTYDAVSQQQRGYIIIERVTKDSL
ncbi:MAG TPA: glutathione gamma-glutamylcysteinyltransferase [Coxiellaceae bacterium]|nr:glutathione gamma-glutamylcysteinyltransferase [Coxiellaceae bacterium]